MQIGLIAGDVGQADRVAPHLGLRLFRFAAKMGLQRHVYAPPEQELIDAVVLHRKALIQAPVGIDFGGEGMPAPVGLQPERRRDLIRQRRNGVAFSCRERCG